VLDNRWGWAGFGNAAGSRRTPAALHVYFELRLAAENVVIVLGEAMGLVTDVLQQLQSHVVALEP
jgi:hypothetical protein